jgi:hypothetical protein
MGLYWEGTSDCAVVLCPPEAYKFLAFIMETKTASFLVDCLGSVKKQIAIDHATCFEKLLETFLWEEFGPSTPGIKLDRTRYPFFIGTLLADNLVRINERIEIPKITLNAQNDYGGLTASTCLPDHAGKLLEEMRCGRSSSNYQLVIPKPKSGSFDLAMFQLTDSSTSKAIGIGWQLKLYGSGTRFGESELINEIRKNKPFAKSGEFYQFVLIIACTNYSKTYKDLIMKNNGKSVAFTQNLITDALNVEMKSCGIDQVILLNLQAESGRFAEFFKIDYNLNWACKAFIEKFVHTEENVEE